MLPPEHFFRSAAYLRHNQRRLEHLSSLGLPIRDATVLEVGAGIGDHTSYFLDRGCQVVSVEARPENLRYLREIYPQVESLLMDLDAPDPTFCRKFDIVYCYGLLYHLQKPADALGYMAERCGKLFVLETCVSFGQGKLINSCSEDNADPTQAFSGMGCRPTRDWVYSQLEKHFEYVYLTATQPNHEEFPIDWNEPSEPGSLIRSVFVAARSKLHNDRLTQEIPVKQVRH